VKLRPSVALVCFGAYLGIVIRYSGHPSQGERAVFERINSGAEHPWLRIPQQWGTPWTLPALAAVSVARGRMRVAVSALVCIPAEKVVEVATKRWRERPRPIYIQPTALRDDAPVEGGSMPSGHAAIAACGAAILASMTSSTVAAVIAAVTAMAGWERIHQGAHEPADVVAGLAMGTGLGLAVLEVTERVTAIVSAV
jgi:membrane-associated phospholipid phosphatase